MPSIKTAIAAGTTVLALGGLTAVALSAGSTDSVAGSVPAPTSARPIVRTVVVTHVVHRTRRAKAAPGAVSATAPSATPVARALPGSAAPAPTIAIAADERGSEREGAGDDGHDRQATDDIDDARGHDEGGGDD